MQTEIIFSIFKAHRFTLQVWLLGGVSAVRENLIGQHTEILIT